MTRPTAATANEGHLRAAPLRDGAVRSRTTGPPVDPRLLRTAGAVRGHLIVSVLCGGALTLLIVLQAWLVAGAVAGASGGAAPSTLAPLVAGVAGVALVRAVLAHGAESAALRSAARARSQLRMRLVRHLAAHPPGPDGPGAGEMVTLATRGLDALDDYFARYLPQLVLAVLVPVAVLVVIADADWVSALVIAVTLPLIPIFMALVGMHTNARTRRHWRMLARLGGHFLDVVQGLPTLALFRRAGAVATQVRRTTDEHRRATMATLRVAFLSAFVLEVLATLAVALVAVEVGLRLLSGNLDFETALLVLILAPEAYLPLREVGARFHASMEGVAAARQVFDVLDGPAQQGTTDDPLSRSRGTDSADVTTDLHNGSTVTSGWSGQRERDARPARVPPGPDSARWPVTPDVVSDRPAARGRRPGRGGTGLVLDGVVVRYPGTRRPALDGLTLTVDPGEAVLVRGPSGAGKSTLLALLLRFADAESGTVRVHSPDGPDSDSSEPNAYEPGSSEPDSSEPDSSEPDSSEPDSSEPGSSEPGGSDLDAFDLDDLDPDVWRRTVAWVPQHPHLFDGSLADNIRLGEPDAPDAAVRRAAGRAGLDTVAAALPHGYDTPLGENGARLSSGERQRVALARAFLRDAPLVLLDEPTAHLDPDTADAVRAAAAELLTGRTALIVAHDDGWAALTHRTVTLRDGALAGAPADTALDPDSGHRAPSPGAPGTGGERTVSAARPGEETDHAARLDRRPTHTECFGQRSSFPERSGVEADQATPPGGQQLPTERFGRQSSFPHRADAEADRAGPPGHQVPTGRFGERSSSTGHADGPAGRARSRGRPGSVLAPILRPRMRQIVAGAALGAVATACGAGLLSLAAWLIATAATHPSITALSVAVVLTRALGVGRGVARYLERLVTHDAALRALADARNRVYARLAATGPIRRFRSGDLVTRLVSDTDSVQDAIVRGVVPPVAAVLAGSGAVLLAGALLLPGGVLLAAGLLVAGVAVPALAAVAGRGPATRAARERARLSTALVDALHGAPDLIAYGAMDRAVGAVDRCDERITRVARRDARLLGLGAGASALVAGLTLAGSLLLGVAAVGHGSLGPVPMAVLVLTTLAAFEIVAPLPALAARAGGIRAGLHRLDDVLTPPAPSPATGSPAPAGRRPGHRSGRRMIEQPWRPDRRDRGAVAPAGRGGAAGGDPAGSDPLPERGDLRVRGLTVAYPEAEGPGRTVLDGLDLDVPDGTCVALVGPSGSGKSTLAGVLFGFLGPDEVAAGSVTLGGTELLGRDPDEVRTRVSGVPQDPHVFDSTVRENLRLARPDAGDPQLRTVLERVGLGGLDLDDPVGTHGRRLSGGMRRRIAVARALLTDPAVLVLDEPTAHLDPETREAVLDDVLDAARGRSVLLITHDPACVRRADAVYRLPSGDDHAPRSAGEPLAYAGPNTP